MEQCAINISNLSKTDCQGLYGVVTGLWLDRVERTVTDSDALLLATWDAFAIAAEASRLYVPIIANPDDVERTKDDAIIRTGNTGKRRKIRDGQLSYKFRIGNPTICQANKIKSLDGQRFYAWFLTANEAILCSGSGTNNKPIAVDVYVNEYTTPENQDEISYVDIHVFVVPTSGYFTKVILPYKQTVNPWRPSDFNGVINVDLDVFSSSAAGSTVVVDVTTQCDGTEVNDIVTAADFIIENVSTGAIITPTVLASSGNRYTLTATVVNATSYFIYLKPAGSSVNALYETQLNGAVQKTQFTASA